MGFGLPSRPRGLAGWQAELLLQLSFLAIYLPMPQNPTQFINFGLGPVVSRTSNLLPLAGNVVAFCIAAAAVGYSPKISQAVGLTTDEDAA